MSLNQCTSAVELRREIRLQTFLAIQGKYAPGKTTELTNDVNTIVDAILSEDSEAANLKKHLADIDAITKKIHDSMGVSSSLLGGGADSRAKRMEISKDIMNQPYNSVSYSCQYKDHAIIGGTHDGAMRSLTIDDNGRPHQETIGLEIPKVLGEYYLAPTIYYRHYIMISGGVHGIARWFYCDEPDISEWSETELLAVLDRINNLFVDKKPSDQAKKPNIVLSYVCFQCGESNHFKEIQVDQEGKPVSEELVFNSTTYYRHQVGLTVNGDFKGYWFFSESKTLCSIPHKALFEIWDFIHTEQDSMPAKKKVEGETEVLFFGGDMDGNALRVLANPNGIANQKVIRPIDSMDKYYLHTLTVGFDSAMKTYYFYSCKQYYTELLPESAANVLSKLVEFHKED